MEEMVMDSAFWQGKRVLITGHTGFKGGWLALWLQLLGAEVVGFALDPPSEPNLFSIAQVDKGMRSVIGDIRDLTLLTRVFAEARPQIVVHMAAQPLVRYSYENPVETYEVNVLGTVNVLEAVRHSETVRAVVNVTSDKCYENKEWVWGYREVDPMGGYDPYSSSKGCAELVAAAYRNSFFNPDHFDTHGVALASVRAGNVIGGGDWAADRLVPDIVRSLVAGEPVRIRNPDAVRPWQHVLEPLAGYVLLAERLWTEGPSFVGAWNFGPYDEDVKPVSWVVDVLSKIWDAESPAWHADEGKHPHEARYLKLDCSKAHAELGWHPQWDLKHALVAVAEWNKAYRDGQDMRKVTLRQIESYVKEKRNRD